MIAAMSPEKRDFFCFIGVIHRRELTVRFLFGIL